MNRMQCILSFIALLSGIGFISQGAYIHTKALLAQVLLESAWAQTTRDRKEVKPWPWADTWPVSRLSVPRLGISRIVLAGTSGESLAFGPGHFSGSAIPGENGNIVIAGHRDTHFKFIQSLRIDDLLSMETRSGQYHVFKITSQQVVNDNDVQYLFRGDTSKLTLITCYPFEALQAGGPLRYVVVAKPVTTKGHDESNT